MATPMETDEQADDTMGAQSISSASQSSIATTIVMDIESMMWDTVVTPQCAPIVLQQLVEAEFAPQFYTNNNEHLKAQGADNDLEHSINSARQVHSHSSNERHQ
eukprot:3658526-Amphidinium_carterae.1